MFKFLVQIIKGKNIVYSDFTDTIAAFPKKARDSLYIEGNFHHSEEDNRFICDYIYGIIKSADGGLK